MEIDFSRYPFDSEDNFSKFKTKLQRRQEVKLLFERIRNCPKKKRTNMHYEEVVVILPHNPPNPHVLNLNVPEPDKRFPSEDDQDHVKNPKKSLPPIDEDPPRSEKQQSSRKKAKMEGPDPPPEKPRWLRDVVEEMGGHGERLLIQKKLSDSDLQSGQNRISMPVLQLRGPDDFLTEEELAKVLKRKDDKGKHFEGMNATFVEPSSGSSMLSLRKWDYGSSSSYAFVGKTLKDFVKANGLQVGDTVQIRFFRCGNGNPYFALVKITSENQSTNNAR